MSEQITEARRWLAALQVHGAQIGADAARAATLIKRIDDAYPHTLFNLENDGQIIGARRVFGDRSYIDFFHADALSGKCTLGVMGEGVLGAAGNGRLIT